MTILDSVLEFVKVVASEVSGPNAATLYNVTGAPGFRVDALGNPVGSDEADEAGEQAISQTGYNALGVVARPLPPEGELYAEAVAARTADGLEPIAWRDLRINRALNPTGANTAPKAGQTMFAGYRGAFLSHESDGPTTLYFPYSFDAEGVATKAHAVVLDESSVQLIHGDGVFFNLVDDAGGGQPGINWAVGNGSFGKVTADEFTVQAPKITLKGNVYAGAQAEAGVPLLAGPASPPCPSLFVSPV